MPSIPPHRMKPAGGRSGLAQPRDDAVAVALQHVPADEVRTRKLVPLVRDAGLRELAAELPLAGSHRGLVDVLVQAGHQEDALVAVAVDPLDRVVGTHPALVP